MVANFFLKDKYFYILGCASLFALVFCFGKKIGLIKHPKRNVYLFLTCFASIAWLKLFTSIILDMILYISLYFKISETFLSVVIVSIGNSLGDLFNISALSSLGDENMAFLGTFSS